MADWIDEAAAQLDRLQGKHREKQRATVIALVDARISGRSEETVWSLPETCSRNIYHSKWKKEPTFAEVLASVTEIAQGWKDTESLRALKAAAKRLALASPVAVGKLITLLNSPDENIVYRAATGILDRAGVETAVKASTEVSGPDGDALRVIVDK